MLDLVKEVFWGAVDYENIPLYCSHCCRQGHIRDNCLILNPSPRIATKISDKETKKHRVPETQLPKSYAGSFIDPNDVV